MRVHIGEYWVVRLFVSLGVEKGRLTGGSRCCGRGLGRWCAGSRCEPRICRTGLVGEMRAEGLPIDIALTTNGHCGMGWPQPCRHAD